MSFLFNGTEGINISERYGTGPLNLIVSYPFTISCWFYPTDLTAGAQRDIVHLEDNSVPNNYWIDHLGTSLRIQTWNGTSVTSASIGTIALNRWNHAFGRFISNTNRFIQLNGTSSATSTTNSGQTTRKINGLSIGQTEQKGRLFQGYIGHVAIYNGSIQAGDALSLARGASPLSVRPLNLVAYFPMDNPGPQRNIAASQSIANKPLPINNTGTKYSNWNPPIPTVSPKARILRLPVTVVSAGNTPVLYHQRQQQGMAS